MINLLQVSDLKQLILLIKNHHRQTHNIMTAGVHINVLGVSNPSNPLLSDIANIVGTTMAHAYRM